MAESALKRLLMAAASSQKEIFRLVDRIGEVKKELI
jgi:hypothetical protein